MFLVLPRYGNVMISKQLKLIQPTIEREREFLDMVADFRAAGETRFDAVPELLRHDFAAYVARLHENAQGAALKPGHVSATAYWLSDYDTGAILGISWLRHTLSPTLEFEGGHIGYAIRPSARRNGYGAILLAMVLLEAKQLGLPRVLLTCDTDNIASARIIEKNGGVLGGQGISTQSGKPISRYWIGLATPTPAANLQA
jgi:predicted acetyltransferase